MSLFWEIAIVWGIVLAMMSFGVAVVSMIAAIADVASYGKVDRKNGLTLAAATFWIAVCVYATSLVN